MKPTTNTALRVMELFPTPLFIVQTEGLDNHQLSAELYAVRDEEARAGIADKEGRSNLGGFRSYDVLDRAAFQPLKQHILKTLNEHMVKGKWFAEPEVSAAQFASMWGVINSRGHSNSTHNHPDSWMSGVYYARVPSDPSKAGSIGFRDPILARSFTQAFYRSVQSELCSIEPKEGLLILFPSWAEHFVGPNQTDEDRIAISFNIRHVSTLR
ncbi:MAG: TIGR02466 family protein [Gammaproteobacteria bacterium]